MHLKVIDAKHTKRENTRHPGSGLTSAGNGNYLRRISQQLWMLA